jgi:hypothetical protein
MREVDVSQDSELFNNMLGFRFQPQKQRRMEKKWIIDSKWFKHIPPKKVGVLCL